MTLSNLHNYTSVVDRILSECDRPGYVCFALNGAPGSGKSRLLVQVHSEVRSKYLAIHIDCEKPHTVQDIALRLVGSANQLEMTRLRTQFATIEASSLWIKDASLRNVDVSPSSSFSDRETFGFLATALSDDLAALDRKLVLLIDHSDLVGDGVRDAICLLLDCMRSADNGVVVSCRTTSDSFLRRRRYGTCCFATQEYDVVELPVEPLDEQSVAEWAAEIGARMSGQELSTLAKTSGGLAGAVLGGLQNCLMAGE